MQLIWNCSGLLLMLFVAEFCQAEWVKRYEENYHRPHYYNREHKSQMHVDYNREAMDKRDLPLPLKEKPPLPEFDASVHKSFYVNIFYKESVICAGALITRRMIITSSRCFITDVNDPTIEYKARYMSVRTGNDFSKPKHQPWRVIAFFMPIADGEHGVHNIALIALAHKLKKGDYRYIPLFSQMPKAGKELQMAFLEATHFEITLYDTKVVETDSCKETFEKNAGINLTINEEFFCVANNAKGDCSTRPGDPVIVDNKLAGINIYGEHCDELEGGKMVDVYYAIRHTIPFIQRATDMLRAFTGTGPFNSSYTTKRTLLVTPSTTEASEVTLI